MDRSFFRRSSRDTSPLLPQHSSSKSYPLVDLPPRPYSDSQSPSRRSQASSSPSVHSHRPHVQFSYPPPPITSSVLPNAQQPSPLRSLSSSRTVPSISTASNPLTPLSRREKAIQSELQVLLDAQSAGLIQGRIGNQNGDDRSSNAGSSTPTSRSMALSPTRGIDERSRSRNLGVIPVRQPRKKQIGLNSARKGILTAMEELSVVKQQEETIFNSEMDDLQSLLQQVNLWEKKMASFEQEMKRISNGAEGREIAELKTEKSAVETEIRDLEDRLLSLRARDRHLARRIEEVGNRKEAELSSFREGQRGVENEVNDFLKRPPVLEVSTAVATMLDNMDGGRHGMEAIEGFLSLAPKRRTLEMAKDYLSSCSSLLKDQQVATESEIEALQQGARVWSETVSVVTAFEHALREQMAEGKELGKEDLEIQLERMETVIRELEGKAREAEIKGWNLLICAIGAELEAFKEGQGLLKGVLGTLDPTQHGEGHVRDESILDGQRGSEGLMDNGTETHNVHDPGDGFLARDGFGHDDHGARREQSFEESFNTADSGNRTGIEHGNGNAYGQEADRGGERARSPYRSETESEDDGPPPALLVGVEEDDDA